MKKIILIVYLIFCAIINGQEIISLEYDNTGLHYKEPEIKTIGYSGRGYKFKNISIPTLQVFLPKGKSQPSTAIVVCPGGGMKSNAFFHEGLDVAKALNEKGIAAFVLKYRLVPSHLIGKNQGLNELYLKEKTVDLWTSGCTECHCSC